MKTNVLKHLDKALKIKDLSEEAKEKLEAKKKALEKDKSIRK